MNYSLQQTPTRPIPYSLSSTSPQPPKRPVKDEFDLLQKLHSQNNQLIEQIKYLSKQNQSLNTMLQTKLTNNQLSPYKKTRDAYVKRVDSPYAGDRQMAAIRYSTPDKVRSYSGRNVRDKLLKNRQDEKELKENQRNKKKEVLYSYERPNRETAPASIKNPQIKNPFKMIQQALNKSTQNKRKSEIKVVEDSYRREEEDSLEIAEVEMPITKDINRSESKLSQSKINEFYPINTLQTKHHPNNPPRQEQATFRNKYKKVGWKDRQEQSGRKKTNQPYLNVLTQSTTSPHLFYPNKVPQVEQNTPQKRSHNIYTMTEPKLERLYTLS